jgi:hypothetical protein
VSIILSNIGIYAFILGFAFYGAVWAMLGLVFCLWLHEWSFNKRLLGHVLGNTLTIWATFAASKVPSLTIDENADSRSTSAVFQSVTLFYAVCWIYFLLNPVVFDQIKSGFLLRGMVFGRHFVTFAIFSYERGIYAQQWCFWWVNLCVLPSVLMRFFLNKIVSLCDTHWGHFNKFAKFVKLIKMATVQRVKACIQVFTVCLTCFSAFISVGILLKKRKFLLWTVFQKILKSVNKHQFYLLYKVKLTKIHQF